MWLKLDLDGIKLFFKISGYNKSTHNSWDDEWCGVELTVQSQSWLNYSQSGQLLLACEVEEILSQFEDLVDDNISETKEIEFIEPDFKLILNPKKDLRQDPRYTYVKEGCEIVDIDVEFRISFWDGGLTANYLSLCMNRDDILAFIVYLKVITKQINKTDPLAQELLSTGVLLDYGY